MIDFHEIKYNNEVNYAKLWLIIRNYSTIWKQEVRKRLPEEESLEGLEGLGPKG